MKRVLWAGLTGLSIVVLALSVRPVLALVARPVAPPAPLRIGQAAAIVVGKVIEVEGATVKAERHPGDKGKGEYAVARIKVEDAITGQKAGAEIRVAFLLPASGGAPGGRVGPSVPPQIRPPFRPRPFLQPVKLHKGQEGCFILTRHHKENFYLVSNTFDVIEKKAPNFDAQVKELKLFAKLSVNPMAGLQSKDAEERFRAAAILLYRYRTAKGPVRRQEAIPAGESKLIALALADANWTVQPGRGNQLNPQSLFYMIDPIKQGFKQPRDFRQYPAAARQWLKANAGTIRIQRLISDEDPSK
jgi:hypothetical protein